MIRPIDYILDDFPAEELGSRAFQSLKLEDLHGSELVDTLILLRFLDVTTIAKCLKEKFDIQLEWIDSDSTPNELVKVSRRYSVLFEKRAPQVMTVYIPLGQDVDDAALQVDIPNYKFEYVYIADCNYRAVTQDINLDILSFNLAPFRPLLVLRRLILDCSDRGGTDIHFASIYRNKRPHHGVYYRIDRELRPSTFNLDKEMIQRVAQAAVAKLSSASAADLDSTAGITTDIPDFFGDETCDLRLTGMRDDAGFYIDIAIQNTSTTSLRLEQLGFPQSDVDLIREISKRHTGLTLVTGEMRSGKNTTISSLLHELVNLPIRIVEYSNPIEIRMPYPQMNYKGDISVLQNWLRLSKKLDIDICVLNEIPNADVAFAVRDLVNSAIGVITTTHINRIWHLPYKLNEFFGKDYKSIISQLNAVLNHKMFKKWSDTELVQHQFIPNGSEYDKRMWDFGVRHYYTPVNPDKVKFRLQPLIEALVISDSMKTQMLNFDELWQAERLIREEITKRKGLIEYKLAAYINAGICSIDEFMKL